MKGKGRELIGAGGSPQVERFLRRLMGSLQLAEVKAKRALAVGCGDGGEAAYLAERGYRVDAVDVEPHPRWKAIAQRWKGRIRFRVANAERLAALKAPYDLVFEKDMLHHVDDPAEALRQMKRLVKPGGALKLLECNRLNPVSYVHLTLFGDHDHFTPGKLARLMGQAGLQGSTLARCEARVWPFLGPAGQAWMDKVQDLVERTPGLNRLCVYLVAAWENPGRRGGKA